MDGHHYVNRPGPRLVDTLELFASAVHPEAFETPPTDVVRPLTRTPA
jgi:iron complex transport system substrate-binding protein